MTQFDGLVSGVGDRESLWGTFSVADHLRPRPFVADVLLYDLLVVPVPDGQSELERWRGLDRDPDLQRNLLAIIDDLAVAIPWSVAHHERWAQRYGETKDVAGAGVEASVRDAVAQGVAFDARNVAAARANPAGPRNPNNPDDPAFMLTRMVLADEIGSRKDRLLVQHIPTAEAVVAYGSYRDFQDHRGALAKRVEPGREPVFTFGWSFFVPSNSKRSDADLLREAVELAHADQVLAWRTAVQRWRRNSILKGQSDAEALRDMEALIGDYTEAAQKKKIRVKARWGFSIAAAVAGSAATFIPLVGIPAAILGLGSLIPHHDIPKRLETAAVFHDARRRFA